MHAPNARCTATPSRPLPCSPLTLARASPLVPSQKPTVVVQHTELVASPYTAVKKLHADLTAAGVPSLTLPTEAQVLRLAREEQRVVPVGHHGVGRRARLEEPRCDVEVAVGAAHLVSSQLYVVTGE